MSAGNSRIIGVLLAAGRSRRMGCAKQLLPWPPLPSLKPGSTESGRSTSTVVAASFDLVAQSCDDMVVVLGHNAVQVCHALEPRQFASVVVDPDGEMFQSICAGIRAAMELQAQAVLLHLVDLPGVSSQTVSILKDCFLKEPARAVMPTFQGKGGHPVFIPNGILGKILAHAKRGGLREFWREHPHCCQRLPVNDAGVVLDLDKAQDYRSPPRRSH